MITLMLTRSNYYCSHDPIAVAMEQIEALNEEKKRLSSDIVELQNRMRDELEIQQLQHFKVSKINAIGTF